MSSIVADLINRHEDAGNDSNSSEEEERDGEGDLFDRRPIVVYGIGS